MGLRVVLSLILLMLVASASAETMTNVPTSSRPAASTDAFMEAAQSMHQNMMIEYSGNADLDFVRGMLPHHQGAVDMAQIELKYGTDPQLRKLASNIIRDQKAEINFMNDWEARHGG